MNSILYRLSRPSDFDIKGLPERVQDRMVSVLTNPRPLVQSGSYYGPAPRKMSSYKPGADQPIANPILVN